MKKNIQFLMACMMAFGSVYAQKRINEAPHAINVAPTDERWVKWINETANEFKTGKRESRNYSLPVVVHVIHYGEAVGTGPNITAAQVASQIQVLNEDYAGINADTAKIPAVFKTVKAGDTGIRFCMAKTDPQGNILTEAGVNRVNASAKKWKQTKNLTWDELYLYVRDTIQPATVWNPKKYVNIWVLDMTASTQGLRFGYSMFPAGSNVPGIPYVETETNSGLVIHTTAFGRTGNVLNPTTKGRTATRNMGIYLGVLNIWGDASCGNDYCNDTPPQFNAQGNIGAPIHPLNVGKCTGNNQGEMFMNFMDLTNDTVKCLFTNEQKARMQAVMASGYYRVSLTTSKACDTLPKLNAGIDKIKLPIANGYTCLNTIAPKVSLINEGSLAITNATIEYKIDNAAPITFAWTGNLTKLTAVDVTLPVSTPLTVGQHTLKVTVKKPNGGVDQDTINDNKTVNFYVSTAISTMPFTQDFEGAAFPPAEWTVINYDEDVTWARENVSAKGIGTGSALIDNYSSVITIKGHKDELQSPKFDLSKYTKLNLKFDVAYQQYDSVTSDTLSVLASIDCGASWREIYRKSGKALATKPGASGDLKFVPTAKEWRNDSIDITNYCGKPQVSFLFRNISGWSQALYLDNIQIKTPTISNITSADHAISEVKIYPNPTAGNFTVQFNSSVKDEYIIYVTNALGQQVYQERLAGFVGPYNKQFDFNALAKGVYSVRIINSVNQINEKVIVY